MNYLWTAWYIVGTKWIVSKNTCSYLVERKAELYIGDFGIFGVTWLCYSGPVALFFHQEESLNISISMGYISTVTTSLDSWNQAVRFLCLTDSKVTYIKMHLHFFPSPNPFLVVSPHFRRVFQGGLPFYDLAGLVLAFIRLVWNAFSPK